jgi:tetratricopeptide (TPR) repeat protein
VEVDADPGAGPGLAWGLDLDVLRPATFARLSQVLHAAQEAGRPYHVVHFDGHGTWLDLADLSVGPAGAGDGAPSGGGGGVGVSPHMYGVSVTWDRERAAAALAAPVASLTQGQRIRLRNLGVDLNDLGNALSTQDDPGCLPHYQESLALTQKIGDRAAEAQAAGSLGNAYLTVPGLRDLNQAERWFRHSLSLRPDSDRYGRALNLSSLGAVALARFDDARAAGEAEPVLLEHLNAALRSYQQSLDLTPADDHETRGIIEHQFGNIFGRAGGTVQALHHYQRALQHKEARGDIYAAGQTRYNIALLLARDGRTGDALHYARAALDNYQQAGADADADDARQLIAGLGQTSR